MTTRMCGEFTCEVTGNGLEVSAVKGWECIVLEMTKLDNTKVHVHLTPQQVRNLIRVMFDAQEASR